MFTFTEYFHDLRSILLRISERQMTGLLERLLTVRTEGGRLFVLGVGGSAANAAHAVNDFRKLCGIEAYAPTDNVAELTARVNDESWASTFIAWLDVSRLGPKDAILVLSVGGGSVRVSPNLGAAVDFAVARKATILGIVGRDGGHTAAHAHACIIVPTINAARTTPYVESMQGVILHALVTHPQLALRRPRWDRVDDSLNASV
jgi:D-sedoheptulose 7-phosphate isomerase